MGLNFLPQDPKEAIYSKFKGPLQYIRIASLVLLGLQLLYLFIISDDPLISSEGLCILLALVFEILAVLTYSVSELGKITCLLFVISWGFITTKGLIMIFISPSFGLFDLIEYLPFTVLLIDYILNHIAIHRIQYPLPSGFLLLHLLFNIDFSLDYSVFLFIVHFVVLLIVLEVSRVIKTGSCRQSEGEQKLI